MKKKRPIQTRLLLTFVGMTTAILVTLGLSFNLLVRGYIRGRVASQLASVSQSISSERKTGRYREQGSRPEERPDRITGTMGSALIVDENGRLIDRSYGDSEVSQVLAAYFENNGIDENISGKILTLENGTYAVSVSEDALEKNHYLVAYVDVTAILALTSRINLMLVVIILISILLCIILSRRFAKSFAEPVQKLSAFAGEIGSGKLSRQEFQFCDIEFDMLADSMNRMAEDLEKEKRKQEVFYQNVSHELRTPLTSIRGSAEGIVYDVLDAKSAAEVILAESDKLQHMVEDILYLSREGRVFPETEVEPLDLREVLSLCAFEQRLEAEKKGVSFVYDFAEEPLMISIQETHAQRLFGNLISNAIRYAEHQVRLCARAENETIFVSVADDGPGIPKEELPHVFDRFFTGKGGQHGIGLSIAKSAAGNYHGTILARNDGGCVFEVRLPMDPKIPVPDQES